MHKLLLFHRDGIEATLTRYAPDERMATHSHDFDQVSWVLTGGLQESSGRRDREIAGPAMGIKPAGLQHSNRYTLGGTLILAINIHSDDVLDDEAVSLRRWSWTRDCEHVNRAAALPRLAVHSENEATDEVIDLLSIATSGPAPEARKTPGWLQRVRDRLDANGDEATLDEIAASEGIHRVHLSRTFAQCFGSTPTLYRRRSRLARAIDSLGTGESLAGAALKAGFADQAHLTREVRNLLGTTPARLQGALLAG